MHSICLEQESRVRAAIMLQPIVVDCLLSSKTEYNLRVVQLIQNIKHIDKIILRGTGIYGAYLDVEVLEAIILACRDTSIREIVFEQCYLSHISIDMLSTNLGNPNWLPLLADLFRYVSSVGLSNMVLVGPDVPIMERVLEKVWQLEAFMLSSVDAISSEAVLAIEKSVLRPDSCLYRLAVRNCVLSESDCERLTALSGRYLKALIVAPRSVFSKPISPPFWSVSMSLRVIDLSMMNISESNLLVMVPRLGEQLRSLNIAYNQVTDKVARAVGMYLARAECQLESLDIRSRKMSNLGMLAVLFGLQGNIWLRSLSMFERASEKLSVYNRLIYSFPKLELVFGQRQATLSLDILLKRNNVINHCLQAKYLDCDKRESVNQYFVGDALLTGWGACYMRLAMQHGYRLLDNDHAQELRQDVDNVLKRGCWFSDKLINAVIFDYAQQLQDSNLCAVYACAANFHDDTICWLWPVFQGIDVPGLSLHMTFEQGVSVINDVEDEHLKKQIVDRLLVIAKKQYEFGFCSTRILSTLSDMTLAKDVQAKFANKGIGATIWRLLSL